MNNKVIYVKCFGKNVGRIAMTKNYCCAFEYDDEWLLNGFSISPRSLPLIKRVFVADREPFRGNFGVFEDSLPDGWGRLLIDRMLLKKGLLPSDVGILDRLAIVAKSGCGALEYEPGENWFDGNLSVSQLDDLAKECEKILKDDNYESGQLATLTEKGGSSGGARPKILIKIDGEDWIIKFPSSFDPKTAGKQEYLYSVAAKEAKIEMSETRLFENKYFGTKRFDRENGQKYHILSASGLLELSHRYPSLDYNDLFSAALQLSKNFADIEKIFRLMCFNVFAKNLDDHSKNFSFIYKDGKWGISPAYDLTFSGGFNGERATTVNGNGKNPSIADILAVAKKNGINETKAKNICEEVQTAVNKILGIKEEILGTGKY